MFFYPFDKQVIRIELGATPASNLTNCPSAFELEANALEGSGEWSVDSSSAYWDVSEDTTQGSIFEALMQEDGAPRQQSLGSCVLEIEIHRNAGGFVISNLFPTLIVVFGGLGAMRIDLAMAASFHSLRRLFGGLFHNLHRPFRSHVHASLPQLPSTAPFHSSLPQLPSTAPFHSFLLSAHRVERVRAQARCGSTRRSHLSWEVASRS